jgi:hypothetical protein
MLNTLEAISIETVPAAKYMLILVTADRAILGRYYNLNLLVGVRCSFWL